MPRPRSAPAQLPAAEPTAPVGWRRRAMPALGTLVDLSVRCSSDDEFERIASAAFARLSLYQRAMSFHEAGSDVRAIAAARAGDRVKVQPETWAVLDAALRFERESSGFFNVAVAPALVRRGLLPTPDVASATPRLSPSACAALELLDDDLVGIVAPVWIDLGGIAKGAAVDAALQAACDAGATAAIVNAGGDIAVFGPDDIPIEVVDQARQRRLVGRLGDGAIATSGPFGAGDESALVVPGGAAGAWSARAVTVVAPCCMTADALTKLLAALGRDAAPMLTRHGARGFSIDRHGALQVAGTAS